MAQNDNNVPLIELAETEVDMTQKSASASVYGLMGRRAIYREGLGTVLVNDDYEDSKPIPSPNRTQSKDTIPYPYGQAKPTDSIFPEVGYGPIEQGFGNGLWESRGSKDPNVVNFI